MISRFTSLFKKTDGDEQRAFQRRVVGVLNEAFDDKGFTPGDDPLTVKIGEQVFGLTNIQSNFLLSSKTDHDLREIVVDHFEKVFLESDLIEEREELDWETVKQRLVPQLMPVDFLSKVPLVSLPFGEQIVLGFVIDSEKAYSYVSQSDAARWEVTVFEIRDAAVENLNERSKGIEALSIPGPNGFVVLNTMDGFDAVRIILPRLQELVTETTGSPFYFGVPNRDFLICWSMNADEAFQNQMRSQVSQDFDERPYPLSRFVFEASKNGELNQIENIAVDPRAASAENN